MCNFVEDNARLRNSEDKAITQKVNDAISQPNVDNIRSNITENKLRSLNVEENTQPHHAEYSNIMPNEIKDNTMADDSKCNSTPSNFKDNLKLIKESIDDNVADNVKDSMILNNEKKPEDNTKADNFEESTLRDVDSNKAENIEDNYRTKTYENNIGSYNAQNNIKLGKVENITKPDSLQDHTRSYVVIKDITQDAVENKTQSDDTDDNIKFDNIEDGARKSNFNSIKAEDVERNIRSWSRKDSNSPQITESNAQPDKVENNARSHDTDEKVILNNAEDITGFNKKLERKTEVNENIDNKGISAPIKIIFLLYNSFIAIAFQYVLQYVKIGIVRLHVFVVEDALTENILGIEGDEAPQISNENRNIRSSCMMELAQEQGIIRILRRQFGQKLMQFGLQTIQKVPLSTMMT